jgi:hypothetical protein
MSTLDPKSMRVLDFTQPEVVQRFIEAYFDITRFFNPLPRIARTPDKTVVASTVDDLFIEPPTSTQNPASEEWLVLGVTNIENIGIDGNDILELDYQDAVVNQQLPLRQATRGQYRNGFQGWPGSNGTIGTNEDYVALPVPVLTKRKSNGESFLRIKAELSTTAVAGNRNHYVAWVYLARPPLIQI